MDVEHQVLMSRENQTAELAKETELEASTKGADESKKMESLPPISVGARKDSTKGSTGRHPKILSRHRELDDEDLTLHSSDSDKSNRKTGRSASVVKLKSSKMDAGQVSVDCQTEWSWLEDMRISQRLRSTPSRSRRSQVTSAARASSRMSMSMSGHRTPKPLSGGSYRLDSRDTAFSSEHFTPLPLRDDEYGIPILGINSDSDSSDAEGVTTTEVIQPSEDVAVLPSIGPPQILQYQAESKKKDLEVVEKELTAGERLEQLKLTTETGSDVKCEFCGNEIRPFPTLDAQKELPPDLIYCCEQYKELIYAMINHPAAQKRKSENKISVAPHPPYGSKQARKVAKERAAQRLRERELIRQQASFPTGQATGGGLSSFYQFARQMKTINYMLSSQRCMDEGWTIRPPSPVLDEEPNTDIFEPVLPDDAEGKERSLVQKFYPNGCIFLIHFPDGTGTVLYPSGKPAITISMQSRVYTYIAQDEEGAIMAVFLNTGQGMSYYANDNIRIFIDSIGGLELDIHGSRKKRWTWKEQIDHVHAPPIQPIMFAMTRHLAIRIISQEHITLTFSYGTRACRFQVGSKLKAVAPELFSTPVVDESEQFRNEIKLKVNLVFDRVSNLLRFPNSPKLSVLPLPNYLSSRKDKIDKLKEVQRSKDKGDKKPPEIVVN